MLLGERGEVAERRLAVRNRARRDVLPAFEVVEVVEAAEVEEPVEVGALTEVEVLVGELPDRRGVVGFRGAWGRRHSASAIRKMSPRTANMQQITNAFASVKMPVRIVSIVRGSHR